MLQASICARAPAGNCGTWADEARVDLLKQLWADGLSASQIASRLGEVTRSAVIGKARRLGLEGRAVAARRPAWTGKRVHALRLLKRDGATAQEIAEALGGGATRNAVAGKMHSLDVQGRLALPPAAWPGRRNRKGRKRGAVVRKKPRTDPDLFAFARLSPALLPAVDGLTDQTCHWPVGDPRSARFHFCGNPKARGVPFCGYHAAIAYNPAASRRKAAQCF